MAAPYEKFADRLRQMLDRARFEEGRGRTGALADRYAVSRETARKWLTGLTLPELARIIELAKDFDASFEWLATGRGQVHLRSPPPIDASPTTRAACSTPSATCPSPSAGYWWNSSRKAKGVRDNLNVPAGDRPAVR